MRNRNVTKWYQPLETGSRPAGFIWLRMDMHEACISKDCRISLAPRHWRSATRWSEMSRCVPRWPQRIVGTRGANGDRGKGRHRSGQVCGLTQSATTRALDSLENAGLVHRSRTGRGRTVALTRGRRRKAREIHRERGAWIGALIDVLDNQERHYARGGARQAPDPDLRRGSRPGPAVSALRPDGVHPRSCLQARPWAGGGTRCMCTCPTVWVATRPLDWMMLSPSGASAVRMAWATFIVVNAADELHTAPEQLLA
jgi:DNA-binding transcriptional ArsR family regulator